VDGLCMACMKMVASREPQFVSHGLCDSCASAIESSVVGVTSLINRFDLPILYMQGDPRQVVTANQAACDQFGKELPLVEGRRGGQVFDCIHSFTEAGCGKDQKCEECKVKNAIVDTFVTGTSHRAISTTLEIRMHGRDVPHAIEVSTEKVGNHALVRIDRFVRLPAGHCS